MTDERSELCALWRARVQAAQEAYKSARNHQQALKDELPFLPVSDGGQALRNAVVAEMRALDEYAKVLRVFTDIAIRGKRPDVDIPDDPPR